MEELHLSLFNRVPGKIPQSVNCVEPVIEASLQSNLSSRYRCLAFSFQLRYHWSKPVFSL
jgi:hypothetical protein